MVENKLSDMEAELYDRQIRLWGIESQEKLRAANVLLIGIKSLGFEIAKNILLAGINSLTILDDSVVTEKDLSFNFLLSPTTPLGSKIAEEVLVKAQALNPLVKIKADTTALTSKKPDYFKQFTIVVATGIKFDSILKIDNICRDNKIKFIYGDAFGMFGFAVLDLLEHQFYEDRIVLGRPGLKRKASEKATKQTVKVQGQLNYPPLNKVLILPNTKQDITIIKISSPSNLFICMLTLIEYRRRFNRFPDYNKKEAEIELLRSICEEINKLYKITALNIDKELELIFGDVPPVSAILGGVIAQEVIKAVSHKEVTINNIFLFDPLSFSGKELNVAFSSKMSNH